MLTTAQMSCICSVKIEDEIIDFQFRVVNGKMFFVGFWRYVYFQDHDFPFSIKEEGISMKILFKKQRVCVSISC